MQRKASHSWHQAILRQSRSPQLYEQEIVADTLEGRFGMLTLAAVLVLRRLRAEGKAGRKLADRIYRDVFSGIEHALREEGVGDHSIARKMRARGEAFFGIARALDKALEQNDHQSLIADILVRNEVCAADNSADLAAMVVEWADELDKLTPEQARTGQPGW